MSYANEIAILTAVSVLRAANKRANEAWDAYTRATIAKDDAQVRAREARRTLDGLINNHNPE